MLKFQDNEISLSKEKPSINLSDENHEQLNDSESNLALPNEYEKEPNMIHLNNVRTGSIDLKKSRTNSSLNINNVRYSCEEDNVNSPLNKIQNI